MKLSYKKKLFKIIPYISMCLILITFFISFMLFQIKSDKKYVVNKLESQSKVCMLTFDDGPSLENDTDILNILIQYNVVGTFFYVGGNIENNKSDIKPLFDKILANGSYIGNHTYSHSKYVMKSEKLVDEINKTNELIRNTSSELINASIPIRMPYLQFYSGIDDALTKLNQDKLIGGYLSGDWDFTKYGKDEIIKRYLNNVEKKNILIMHSNEFVKEYLPELIEKLIDKGYNFATFNNKSEKYYMNYGDLAF
ncbi:hypothetical protein SCORR_v1c06400 [Spiroplasma corruscae]|uniref:NodB homology domain-containing protein n=1 Tax=Spiroplasma corruscae TaxID=216934 RepID=A0A222EPN6_9MOLU|nr:polysaccharide deacetylase family protein [Spiroplasma corruscae]ASP28412.1 hypothetical protein SCORR_v1c06400 [Spiroplasma corruscae]